MPADAFSSLSDLDALEAAAAALVNDHYVLSLFVTGMTPLSSRAIVNTRKLCEEHLKGRYDLEVVDISRNVALAASEQVVAAPTLVKRAPLPLRRFIGDMSRTDRLLVGLDLHPVAMTGGAHG